MYPFGLLFKMHRMKYVIYKYGFVQQLIIIVVLATKIIAVKIHKILPCVCTSEQHHMHLKKKQTVCSGIYHSWPLHKYCYFCISKLYSD